MKTKNESRIEDTTPTGPAPDELRTALEVHTLAQMLYGEITSTHPWIAYGPVAEPWHQGYWR